MSLFVSPVVRATDANNDLLSGAKWYFYATGGTTPAAIYTTSALNVAHANPVVADSAGLFAPIYLDPTIAYRATLKTSSGSVIQDIDPYNLIQTGTREILTANRTYYVRTDGSDLNAGLVNTAGGAFLSIQHAIDVVHNLDLAGRQVTIRLADGTYTSGLKQYGKPVGANDSSGEPILIIGNEVTPANVVIAPTSASNTIELSNYAYLLLAGVTLQNAAGSGVQVGFGAVLEHRNCVFGAISSEKILALHRGVVRAIGPTTVTGNSVTFVHSTKRSIVDFSDQTLTFSGSPVFSTYLWGINDSSVDLDSSTIVGTATGAILVHDAGILNVSSLTGSYLGGSSPEVTDGGTIAIRDKLELRTFYVRTDGNDNNDGFANTASRAFLTIQGAVDSVSKQSFNPLAWASGLGASISIVVAAGTYAETVNLRDLHYLSGTIVGDETTPANVIVNGPTYGFISTGIKTPWYVRGVKITATAGDCIHAEQGSQITFRKVELGAASVAHLSATKGGRLIADGDYKAIAGAAYHAFARGTSFIDINGVTVTITGTPAFSGSTTYAELCSVIRMVGTTFTGAATGVRYDARTNAAIDTNGGGATFIPGGTGGSTASGGQYV